MGILGLPNQLLLMIGEYLPIKGLYHFLSTCRQLPPLLTPPLHKLGVQDVDGLTALQWAAERGHAPLAELAISCGAKIEKKGRLGGRRQLGTPLHLAARRNHPAVICVLIKHGAKISAKDYGLRTPLHLAAERGNEEATRVLLELGADMTRPALFSETPICNAIQNRKFGCIKAFVNAGYDFNSPVVRPVGTTILHLAASEESETLEYLLEQEGAKVAINTQDSNGDTPLHSAIEYASGTREVKLLLRHGSDMAVADKYGYTPAHRAAHLNDIEGLKVLIEVGFDTNIRAKIRGVSGRTILHEAVFCSDEMLSYLLGQEEGSRTIDAQDSQGSTPLHLAADCGVEVEKYRPWFPGRRFGDRAKWEEKVQLLVQCGADPKISDSFGITPAHIAAYRGDVNCMKSLLPPGFDFNIRGLCNRTVLHAAIFGGLKVTKYLLKQKGVEVIIDSQDTEGSTPLHLATHRGKKKKEKVRILLRYGADKEKVGHRGRRTLGCGLQRGEYLGRKSLESGAHVSGRR